MAAVISATFELDLKKFMDGLNQVASQSEASADKLKSVFTNAANDLEAKKLKIDVDTARLDEKIKATKNSIQSIGDKKAKIEIDKAAVDGNIKAIKAQIENIKAKKVNMEIDGKAADSQITALKTKLSTLTSKREKLDIDTVAADRQVTELKTKIAGLDDEKIQLKLSKESIDKELTGVKKRMESIQVDPTATPAPMSGGTPSEGLSPTAKIVGVAAAVAGLNELSNQFMGVIGIASEFESTLAAVGAITGFTGKELDKIGDAARSLAKEFGGTASDQLKSFQGVLSKLGPDIAKDSGALESMGKTISTLSAASGDDAATSMNALTDAMLQMGLATGTPAEQAKNMADTANALAAGAQVGAAEIPQVANALVVAGVAAKGAKMDMVGVNAAIQVLAMGGKTGSEAGTALRNVLGLLQKASGPAEAAMKKLGTSSKELGEALTKQGLDAALAKLNEGFNKLQTPAEKNATLMEIFGTESSAAAGILMQNTGKFKEFADGIRAGMEGEGSAVQQAAIRMNTAEAMFSRVKAKLQDLAIGFGQSIGAAGKFALMGAAQIAPLLSTIAGFATVSPILAKIAAETGQFALSVVSKLVPALITETVATDAAGVATTKLAFNKSALSMATLKDAGAKGVNILMTGAMAVATGIATAAQWALNAAFLASPIGWIVLGIGAVVAGMILLYNNVEPVRKGFDMAWNVIKVGATYIWEILKKLGSVLFAVGELVFTYLTLPFQIVWGVISEIGSAIGGFIKDLFGMTEAADSSAGAMSFLTDVFNAVMTGLNYLIAAVKGAVAWIQSIAGSVGSAIGKLFSGDIIGAVDSIMGAGEKAGEAFKEGFTKELNKQNWDDATKTMTEAISQSKTIKMEIGVEPKAKASEELEKYQATMTEIEKLRAKQAQSGLTTADTKALQDLEAQAQKSAGEIGKLAPKTRENFRTVIDASGELRQVWDINIEKAKEFASSADGNQLQGQIDNYSSALSEQALQIVAVTEKQKYKQIEIDKETDPKKKQALIEKYNAENEEIEKNKQAMIESFKQGAINGLLTEGAIANVSKALGITTEEARKMALGEVLKDATSKGAITESQIGKIAKQFGVSTDAVKAMLEEQKKNTEEAQKTADAALSIGDAYEESAKKAKEAADKSVANIAALRAKRAGMLKSGASEQELKENQEQIDAELAQGKKNASYYKDTEKVKKAANEDVYGKEEKKKSGGGSKDKEDPNQDYMQELSKVYSDRDKLETEGGKRSAANAVKALEEKKKAIAASTASEREKLEKTIAIDREIAALQEKIEIEAIETRTKESIAKSREALVQKLGAEKANKKAFEEYSKEKNAISSDETLTAKERTDKLAALDEQYFATMLKNSKANQDTKAALEKGFQQARVNGEQDAEAAIQEIHDKFNTQRQTSEAEANKKLKDNALKEQKELLDAQMKNTNVYSEQAIREKHKLQQELLAIEFGDVINKDPKDRTEKEAEKYKEYQSKMLALDYEMQNAMADLETDEQKKKLEKAILAIEEQLQKELMATQTTEEDKVAAVEEAERKIAELRKQYWLENNTAARMATEFQKSLMEELADTSAEVANEQIEEKRKAINEERKDLEKQLQENKISYAEYAKKVNDLNRKEAEETQGTKSKTQIFVDKIEKAATKTFGKEISKRQKEIDELDAKGEDSSKKRQELLGMEMGQLLMTGQFTLGKASGIALDAMASMITSMVPGWVAGIFGTTTAQLGPWGLAVAAGITATLMGLVATAKSSLGAETGYLPRKKDYQKKPGRTDTQNVWVSPEEAIVPADITSRESGLLSFLFAGGTSDEYFKQNYGGAGVGMTPNPQVVAQLATMNTAPNLTTDRAAQSNAIAQADFLKGIGQLMDKQRKIDVKTSSEHKFSPLTVKKDVITAAVVDSHNVGLDTF